MPSKSSFASYCMGEAANIMHAYNRILELHDVMLSNGWQIGGTNPITDADLTGSGITANELNVFAASFAERINDMMLGNVPAVIYGKNACNTIRNDI